MLIETLKAIEASPDIRTSKSLMNSNGMAKHPLVQLAILEAENELITDSGLPKWHAMDALESAGYPIMRGDSDSFGWVSGVIHTKKGTIPYG